MKTFLNILKSISDIVEKHVGYICMVLVSVMLAVVMIQVTLRMARASVPWSEEFSRILLIWIGMLGAGIAAKHGLHVGVDLLMMILPRKIRSDSRNPDQRGCHLFSRFFYEVQLSFRASRSSGQSHDAGHNYVFSETCAAGWFVLDPGTSILFDCLRYIYILIP